MANVCYGDTSYANPWLQSGAVRLFDINHQQIAEINYRNVFQMIYDKSQQDGREFIIGMEHGKSKRGKEGEVALIQAYRDVDPA